MGSWPLRGDGQRFEAAGVVAASSTGTTLTSAGSTNTKGSYSELIASTAFDADGIFILMSTDVGPTQAGSYLVDIAIGVGGSEEGIISNLPHNQRFEMTRGALFSLSIPAGSRISARCQKTSANQTMVILALLMGSGFLPSAPHGRTETLGADESTSKGTTIDAGASADTKGSWAELKAATDMDIKELLVVLGPNADTSRAIANFLIDIGVGAGGSEETVIPDLLAKTDSTIDMVDNPILGPFPVNIPAGSRVAARVQSGNNTAGLRELDITLIGLG